MAPPPSRFILIWHIRFVTLCTSSRKSSDRSLLCFVFPFSDGSTPWRRDSVCMCVCVTSGQICVLRFVLVCVCVCVFWSSLFLTAEGEARQAARPSHHPKLNGKAVTFGQNQEQSVFCLYCFLRSLSSLSHCLFSLLHLFLSSLLWNGGAEKYKTMAEKRSFGFLFLFFLPYSFEPHPTENTDTRPSLKQHVFFPLSP